MVGDALDFLCILNKEIKKKNLNWGGHRLIASRACVVHVPIGLCAPTLFIYLY